MRPLCRLRAALGFRWVSACLRAPSSGPSGRGLRASSLWSPAGLRGELSEAQLEEGARLPACTRLPARRPPAKEDVPPLFREDSPFGRWVAPAGFQPFKLLL